MEGTVHDESHDPHLGDGRRKLGGVTAINFAGFLLELVGGLLFGSVALLSDAVHMFFDASAYATAYVAAYMAESFEGPEEWTYGFHRFEVFSAILNGFLLIPMAGWIVWEAYQRFVTPSSIDLVPTLLIALGGLAINLVSVAYVHREEGMSLNEEGAFYHLLGDTAGSLAVLIGVGVIYVTGSSVADPVAAVFIAGLVVWSSVRVLRRGTGILMQKSTIPPSEIRRVVEGVEGVVDAHDIRSWQVCSSVDVCTVHVRLAVKTLEKAEAVRGRIESALKENFGLYHVTIQVEGEDGSEE